MRTNTIAKKICIAERLCATLDRCYCPERSNLGYTKVMALATKDELFKDMIEADQIDAMDEFLAFEELVTRIDVLIADIEKELNKIGRYGDEKRRYTRRKVRTITR